VCLPSRPARLDCSSASSDSSRALWLRVFALSTPRQYLNVVEEGKGQWRTFRKGDIIQRKGEEMSKLHVILEGAAECTDANATRQHTPGKGGWLGELYDPNRTAAYWNTPHPATYSIECVSEKCTTLAFDRKALDTVLRANPRLAEAATRAEIADLWGKLHKAGPERKQRTLASILETALCDGDLNPSERQQIDKFCQKYTITDAELTAELQRLGWSMDDYARGVKK